MTEFPALPRVAGERYSLVREVGRGGMGVVYEAVEQATGAPVALKLLPRASPEALLAFKREFRTLATVSHPNLVSPYELVADGDQWFFTMELVPGRDMLSWVRNGRDPRTAGPHFAEQVDEARLRSALRQVTAGVRALHQAGLLHRDLKPPNVLVRTDGHVAILDFGLTVDVRDLLSTEEQTAGTLAYMAPEQLANETLSSASDWYALGVMLYEAMTGQLPFGTNLRQVLFAKMAGVYTRPQELVADIPDDLVLLCEALLHSEPAERATDVEVLACLDAAPGELPTSDDEAHTPATRGLAPVRLVGREHELATLTHCSVAVREGSMRVVAMHGRSGTGKSALLQQFLQEQRADPDVLVLAGRCYEQESVPFKAVDTLVDALTRRLSRLDNDDVASLLPDDIEAAARVFPVLRRVQAIAAAMGMGLNVPDPRELRRRGFHALQALLTNIGRELPLVIAIDDLQWGDLDSAELLVSLLGTPEREAPRALFVIAFRAEYRESSACLQHLLGAVHDGTRAPHLAAALVELAVQPLTEDDAIALASALLGRYGTPDSARRIAEESGGNAFFIGELARFAVEQPDWSTGEEVVGFDLEAVLARRVARLPPAARALLEVVAIAGQPVRNRHWRDAVNAAARGPDVLTQLRQERLIRSTGVAADDEVETYHDRVRETVVARLDPAARRDCHRRLGESLEQHGDGDAETVAVHFVNGGLPVRAWPHYQVAAEGAAQALAFERAAVLFERALTHHEGAPEERAALLMSLGQAHANGGRGRPAGQAFEEAATLADSRELRLDRLRMAASQYCVSGAVDLGRTKFREVLRGVGLHPARSALGIMGQLATRRTRLRLRGLSFAPRAESAVPPLLLRRLDALWAASTALSNVDVVGVAALQSQALLLALKAGEPRRLALALSWEAVLVATSGVSSAARASELLRLGRSLAERTDDPQTHAMMQLSTGWVAFLHARFEDALDTCAQAEEAFRNRCVGVWWELLLSRTLLGWGTAHAGRLPELTAMIRQWEPQARARGDHFLVTNLLSYAMPHERMLRNDVAGARTQLREAIALWPYEGFHIQHVSVLFSEGLLALYEGDGASACAAISARWRVMVSTLQTQNQQTRVMLRDVRARGAVAAAASGIDRSRHLARAERDARSLAREDAPWAQAFGKRLAGGIALVRGDERTGATLLRESLAGLDDAGLALQAAAVRRRLGQLLGGDEGHALITGAETLFAERGIADIEATTRLFSVP